jgi:peroxiredoxin
MGSEGSGDSLKLPFDDAKPTLVVFLRSFGCTFCREALSDVAAVKPAIDAAGANVAFVHTEPATDADPWFAKYGLQDVVHVSDPTLAHYRAFGLGRTKAGSIVDPLVWVRGASCALSHGFGVQTIEMMRRAPGVFLVQRGKILAEYRHRSPADRPDYIAIIRSAQTLVQ